MTSSSDRANIHKLEGMGLIGRNSIRPTGIDPLILKDHRGEYSPNS
ncbi:MAG: hypothetical protein ACUVTD_08995 [Nitrososphaerales archaeon]